MPVCYSGKELCAKWQYAKKKFKSKWNDDSAKGWYAKQNYDSKFYAT